MSPGFAPVEGEHDQGHDRQVHEDQNDPEIDFFQWFHVFHGQSSL